MNRVRQYAASLNQPAGAIASYYLMPIATQLVGVYAAAASWADVLSLVDAFPYWGASDLSEILNKKDCDGSHPWF